MTVLLDIRDLTCQRGDTAQGFRLEVPVLTLAPGEAVAVTGPSGCGKSTLLDVIGLVLRPVRASTFTFDGIDVATLWRDGHRDRLAGVRARGIGYVLQTGGLLPFISVRENIRLSPRLLGRKAEAKDEERLVDSLGIGALLDKRPAALSIGERQRVAIARALIHRPALVLADEPTAALDPHHSRLVIQLMLDLVRDLGLSVMVVSHDWDLLASFGLRRIEAIPSADHVGGGAVTRFAA